MISKNEHLMIVARNKKCTLNEHTNYLMLNVKRNHYDDLKKTIHYNKSFLSILKI